MVFDGHVESGDVAVAMERGLSRSGCEDHTLPVRERLLWDCDGIITAYRTRRPWLGDPLYVNDPVDYYFMLTTPEEGTFGKVPFVTDVDWSTLEVIPID